MEYGQIPGINKKISRLVQGTTMISSSNLDYSLSLLDTVFEQGCTTFDTAHVYGGGDNERTIGRWVNERGIREKVVIIGKGAHHNEDRRRVTPFDIAADIADSLARFKFDYIDLYLLHRDDPSVEVGPIVDALNDHVNAGRIHAFGGSNWSHNRIQAANEYAEKNGLIPFTASSPHFSLAEQYNEPWNECVSITGKNGESARVWYRQTQFPLFAWSSLAGGFFTGRIRRDNLDSLSPGGDTLCKYCYAGEENFKRLDRTEEMAKAKGISPAQLAIAWVMNQGMNIFPLAGSATPEEFRENLEALSIKLTDEEQKYLNLEI